MILLVIFLLVPTHLSFAFLPPSNSSLPLLRLPSPPPPTTFTALRPPTPPLHGKPWPSPPYRRPIKNGLAITITAYGDSLAAKYTAYILKALLAIQRVIRNAGGPRDVLEETTTVGKVAGAVYAEVGFYALHAPAGIERVQAAEVLQKVWELVFEYSPAREITSSTVVAEGRELVLFRLSFRQI